MRTESVGHAIGPICLGSGRSVPRKIGPLVGWVAVELLL